MGIPGRLLSLTVTIMSATIFLIIAALLGRVGQLDEATAAAIQLLLIPVRLVGVFVAVAEAAVSGGALFGEAQPVAETSGDGGGVPGVVIAGLVVLAALAVGRLIFEVRRRRRKLERLKAVAQEHLIILADDVLALDLDTSMPDANPRAVRHYATAVEQYQQAAIALDRARRTEDLAPVAAALKAGRLSMASAKAILERSN